MPAGSGAEACVDFGMEVGPFTVVPFLVNRMTYLVGVPLFDCHPPLLPIRRVPSCTIVGNCVSSGSLAPATCGPARAARATSVSSERVRADIERWLLWGETAPFLP